MELYAVATIHIKLRLQIYTMMEDPVFHKYQMNVGQINPWLAILGTLFNNIGRYHLGSKCLTVFIFHAVELGRKSSITIIVIIISIIAMIMTCIPNLLRMMPSWHGNAFRTTVPLYGEVSGHVSLATSRV